MFEKLFRFKRADVSATEVFHPEYPLEAEARLAAAHAHTPVRRHLEILYDGFAIGAERFTDLYFRCLAHTGTAITPFNIFQRFQTRHDLLRYFFATLAIGGARVECGVYRGATGLLLCHAWRAADHAFKGDRFYLVDSFTGASESSERDLIPVRGDDGLTRKQPFFTARKSDVTPEMVRGFFAEFPDARICVGWVPQVFDSITEERFAWVHIDLTLYEATLAALRYFYPRLSPGGVILCDGSLFCPGVESAMDTFSREQNTGYALLGHRQYVLLREPA